MPTKPSVLPASDVEAILNHMNQDHADAVLRYARAFAGLDGAMSARMEHIDNQGMTLLVQLAEGETRCEIHFATPLQNTEDAHHTLVRMAREARQRLGEAGK